jgi:uncharacterized spore protein YtfJ
MQAAEFQGLIEGMRDLITVKRVYGEPYKQDGLTVIPAAAVRDGGGGGKGQRGPEEEGGGGGLGVMARPSGAWVIKDSEVTWKPAVDVNRIVLGAQLVALAAILTLGRRRLPRSEGRAR